MTIEYERASEAADFLRARLPAPQAAVVLGSGLGGFADVPRDAIVVPYSDIPHFPVARVAGHAGKLVAGEVGGRPVAVMAGRVHLYEGHSARTVAFPVRVLGLLGVKVLMLTNAAGGISTTFAAGTLMAIDDHINLTGANPLIGDNDDRFGPRFPDMSGVWTRRLRELAGRCAAERGIDLRHGVYAALPGPSYETPAEIRWLRTIGADAVGMSTVPEAIAARHMGMDVLGISCITNMAAGVQDQPITHSEVLETAARVRGAFIELLTSLFARI